MYVNAAVKGDTDMQCTITPKVLLMPEHVEWQMMNYYRGRVRRQNEILGQAPASKWEAPAPCHCTVTEPSRLITRQGESKLAQHASRCGCSNRQDKQGEQVQSGGVKG